MISFKINFCKLTQNRKTKIIRYKIVECKFRVKINFSQVKKKKKKIIQTLQQAQIHITALKHLNSELYIYNSSVKIEQRLIDLCVGIKQTPQTDKFFPIGI